MRKATLLLVAVISLPLPLCVVCGQPKPVMLIYTPGSPHYGQELQRIIEGDGRLDAEIELIDSLDNFRVMLYLPYVKVAIISLSVEKDQNLGSALEWFFSEGGGLVALGLTASKTSIGAASETVFPIFGTSYRTGTYDGTAGRLTMTHIKEDEDEISQGLPDFTIPDHKILLSFNTSTQAYLPRSPEAGEYKVLFRESGTGAPSVVKYRNQGVSVTFACLGETTMTGRSTTSGSSRAGTNSGPFSQMPDTGYGATNADTTSIWPKPKCSRRTPSKMPSRSRKRPKD